MEYVTLYELRQYLGLTGDESSDDERLRQFLRWASRFVDQVRRCDVRREARLFDYPVKKRSGFGVYSVDEWVALANSAADLSSGMLRLDDDLLAVESITNGDTTTITAGQYVLQPTNLCPKSRIKLKGSSGVSWQPSADGDREQCITVMGLWGWHPDYDETNRAWEDSGDSVQDNPLTVGATSVTVGNVDGETIFGAAMRFQAGQMIKVESEFMFVLETNTVTNTLTVRRGVNGTTAAQHAQNSTIYIYRPFETVRDCVMRIAVWRYRQKDMDAGNQVYVMGNGVVVKPDDLDIAGLLPPPRPVSLVDTENL